MGPLLKRLTTRSVLIFLWIVRMASGALHVVACFQQVGSGLLEPLIFISRGLHGFTLFNLAIAGSWAGTSQSQPIPHPVHVHRWVGMGSPAAVTRIGIGWQLAHQ